MNDGIMLMDHAFLSHISLACRSCRISIATMPPKRAAAAGASDEVGFVNQALKGRVNGFHMVSHVFTICHRVFR
jgi:hypothetical protein